MPVEETEEEIRVRVASPDKFDSDSFRRVALKESEGIYAIVGCPKGHFHGGKCDTGTEVQSLRFSKDKGWTKDKAENWAREHDYTPKAAKIPLSKAFSFAFDISKVQKEERIIEGYASVEIPDRDEEVICRDALKSAFINYMRNPVLRWMHEREPIGKILDGHVDERGLWIKAYVSDATVKAKEVWGLILNGVVKAFSIGGRVLEVARKYYEKLKKKINHVTKLELLEISIVDIPSNPETLFQVVRKSIGELEKMSEETASSLEERVAALEERVSALESKEEELEEEVEEVKEEVEEEVTAVAPEIDLAKIAEIIRKEVETAVANAKPIRKGIMESEKKEEPVEKKFSIREALLIKHGGQRG